MGRSEVRGAGDLRRRLRALREEVRSGPGPGQRKRAGNTGLGGGLFIRKAPALWGAGRAPAASSFVIEERLLPGTIFPRGTGLPRAGGVDRGGEERWLYFDLETTGLSAQHRIFLCGVLWWEGEELCLRQEVAADVVAERALLENLGQLLASRPRLVTFNGRSFDLPMVRRRRAYHSLSPLSREIEILDLLPLARRRFRGRVQNCRLATLEKEILGSLRDGRDLPGAEVPLRFLDYMESGERRHLDPVLYHNRVDLTTLVSLQRELEEHPA